MMFAVEMTVDQWKLVCSILQEAPYRVSAPLIVEIDRQVSEAVSAGNSQSRQLDRNESVYQRAMDDASRTHPPVDRPDSTIY